MVVGRPARLRAAIQTKRRLLHSSNRAVRRAAAPSRDRNAATRSGEVRRRRLECGRRRRAKPRELALRQLARRGDRRCAQRRRIDVARRETPTPADSRRSASTACRARAHGARASAASSATRPASSIASKRSAIARCSRARSVGHERDGDRRARRAARFARALQLARAACRRSRALRARAGCAARRCASSRPAVAGSTRASSACSAGQPSAAARASRRARTAGSAGGNAERPSVQRLEIEHRPADEQRHGAARADRRRSPRSHRRETAPPNTRRPDRGCRSGDAARARASPRRASPCRCPCRDRPAPNRR